MSAAIPGHRTHRRGLRGTPHQSEGFRMRLGRVARPLSRLVLTAAMCVVGAASAPAQGTITGRITAQDTKEPLGDARVIVVGSIAAAMSAQDGRYTLNNVRAGTVDVQVLRVGYQSLKKSVTVSAGSTASLDFVLAVAVVKLQ